MADTHVVLIQVFQPTIHRSATVLMLCASLKAQMRLFEGN